MAEVPSGVGGRGGSYLAGLGVSHGQVERLGVGLGGGRQFELVRRPRRGGGVVVGRRGGRGGEGRHLVGRALGRVGPNLGCEVGGAGVDVERRRRFLGRGSRGVVRRSRDGVGRQVGRGGGRFGRRRREG